MSQPASANSGAVQIKRLRAVLKRQRTILGVLVREITRKMAATNLAEEVKARLTTLLERAERIRTQKTKDKKKLYALNAPEVECIGKGKADHRMDRCWLKGAEGDALHAVLCAAGFNIRWLMRAILAQAVRAAKALVFGLLWLLSLLQMCREGLRQAQDGHSLAETEQFRCGERVAAQAIRLLFLQRDEFCRADDVQRAAQTHPAGG